MARTALRIAAALAALLCAQVASADINGERYESTDWQIAMTLPPDWQATERTSYPNLLLWMVRHNPKAKLILAVDPLDDPMDSHQYAKVVSERLKALGFETRPPQLHSSTGAYWIDFDDGKTFLRQAVLTVGPYGYSLTLATSSSSARSLLLRAFDYTLRSIRPIRGEGGETSGDD